MSDTDFVSDRVEDLAKYLKEHLGATGSGLGAVARNVREKLPPTLYTGLMQLAFIRNKVVHERLTFPLNLGNQENPYLETREQFEALYRDIVRRLREPLEGNYEILDFAYEAIVPQKKTPKKLVVNKRCPERSTFDLSFAVLAEDESPIANIVVYVEDYNGPNTWESGPTDEYGRTKIAGIELPNGKNRLVLHANVGSVTETIYLP